MNASDIIAALTSFLALVGSGIAVYVAWRKAPREVANLDADTAGKWQTIADKSAGQVEKLTARVDALEKLSQEQEERIRCLEEENADLRDWAERLVHQIKAQGIEPVKMRTRKPNTG